MRIVAAKASSAIEIDAAFAKLSQQKVDALLISPDAVLADRRAQLVALAAQHALRQFILNASLSRTADLSATACRCASLYHQAGIYAGRILNGAKAADLPIVQATTFELVINAATAKALSIKIPDKLIALADEVIE